MLHEKILTAFIAGFIPQIAKESKHSPEELYTMLTECPAKLTTEIENIIRARKNGNAEPTTPTEPKSETFLECFERMKNPKDTFETKVKNLMGSTTFFEYATTLNNSLSEWIAKFGYEPKQTNQGVIGNGENEVIHYQQIYGDFCEGFSVILDNPQKYKVAKIYFIIKDGKADIMTFEDFSSHLKTEMYQDYTNNSMK